jgi:hypothetical protein
MIKYSKLFARKFALTQDVDVLDMIDKNILEGIIDLWYRTIF